MLSSLTFEPKEAAGLLRVWLLPARGFLVKHSINQTHSLAQAHSGTPARRPSRHRRDQKTFSAGPRSFSTKEFWFSKSSGKAAFGVQPIFDSRHGRITGKVFPSCLTQMVESSRLQSVKRAHGSNPFAG